jgi:hypothetical protein
MQRDATAIAYTAALLAGTVLWSVTAALAGRREPWDWAGYWTVAYPLALLLAAVLGYAFPTRPWRWAVALMFTQAAVMAAHGAGLSLLPLGLALLAILALPAVVLARLGARLRKAGSSA